MLESDQLLKYDSLVAKRDTSIHSIWLSKLTSIEKQSLRNYAENFGAIEAMEYDGIYDANGNSTISINDLIRAGIEEGNGFLDSAIEKFGLLPDEIITYRGVGLDALTSQFGQIDVENLDSLVGKVYADKAYMSSTLMEDKAKAAVGKPTDVILKINVPTDDNYGAFIESQSNLSYNQLEFLIKRNSTSLIENAYLNEEGKIVVEMRLFNSKQNNIDNVKKIQINDNPYNQNIVNLLNVSNDMISDMEYSIEQFMKKYNCTREEALNQIKALVEERNFSRMTSYGNARNILRKYSFEELDLIYTKVMLLNTESNVDSFNGYSYSEISDYFEGFGSSENLTYDLPQTFVVKAGIPASVDATVEQVSGSGLAYIWRKQGDDTDLLGSTIYKVDPKTHYNPNEIYYIKQGDGTYKPYYIVGDNNPFDDTNADGGELVLYTRHSGFEPPSAGTYYAIANNIYVPGAYATTKSADWTVPAPVNPAFTFGENTAEIMILDEENGTTIEVAANVSDGGALTTAWYRGDEPNFSAAAPIDGATGSKYTATTEGYYYVEAKNVKNNSTATAVSTAIWAKYEASVPTIISVSGQTTLGSPIKVEVETPAHSESLSYQWKTESDQSIAGATSAEYTPTATGLYRCAVTNTYKGTNKTVYSSWISVTPA